MVMGLLEAIGWISPPVEPPPSALASLSSWLPAAFSSPSPPPPPPAAGMPAFLPQEHQVAVAAAAAFLAVYSGLDEKHAEYSRFVLIALLPVSLLLPSWGACGLAFLTTLSVFLWVTRPLKLSPETPGPCRNIPYFGGIFLIFRTRFTLPTSCLEYSERYGGRTWGMTAPRIGLIGGAAVFLTTPRAVKYVLKENFANYVKGTRVQQCLSELVGNGIFAADGAAWTLHRKVASHMFSMRLLKESTRVAAWQTSRMIAHLRTRGGSAFDLQDFFFRLTMDIFTFIAFGEDLDSFSTAEPHPFGRAFDDVQRCCERRMYNPMWLLAKVFQISSEERTITRGAKVLDDFAATVISGRRRQSGELGPDLLSRFIADADKKVADSSDEARLGASDRELRDIVMNFIIAGRDTTACALSWMFYELASQPDVQRRVREEFDEAFDDVLSAGNGGGGGDDDAKLGERIEAAWSYERVSKLKYTHAVALEVLRLHPSVPKDIKFAVNDDTLPDGTRIPAGASVLYAPYAMGRDPALWEAPLEFRPERFLADGGKEERHYDMYVYPAFNAGPRLCLGKPLALMEIKLVTAMLLHSFDFSLAEPHDGSYSSTIVMPMKGGLKVRLTARSKAVSESFRRNAGETPPISQSAT
jgi:cytochrome P450